MKWLVLVIMGCMFSAYASAITYVYHDGRENVSRVLSMSLSASSHYQVSVLNNPQQQLIDGDLVITVGQHSFKKVCESSKQVSIVALFLGEQEFVQAQAGCSKPTTAVFSGAPLALRLSVLKTFWEDRAPVTIVHSPNIALGEDLVELSEKFGVALQSQVIQTGDREQTLKDLTTVLESSNLVLSLYDSVLFDAQFSKDAIRLMFHKKKALGAHSLQLVRAGALYGIYSTSQEKLSLVSSYIHVYESSQTLMPPSYPMPLRVSFNPYLIRMYGLVLPTDRFLIDELGVCPELGCQESTN
jgi:hypothetical protein